MFGNEIQSFRSARCQSWRGGGVRASQWGVFGCVVIGCLMAQALMGAEGPDLKRAFVEQAEAVSKLATEKYSHQSWMRIIQGTGYVVYNANDLVPEENKAGQLVRLAIFDIHQAAATARWVDVATPGESCEGTLLDGKFVSSGVIHQVNDDTLRFFFCNRQAGDSVSAARVLYKDYAISTGSLSKPHRVRCTIAKHPGTTLDLNCAAIQRHLDFLFGSGFGAAFQAGLSTSCDFVRFDGQLYSAIQIKNSKDGKTILMTNVLMRSSDDGATWELLGAPDPRPLRGEIKVLAEPVITQDDKNVFLHLRSNTLDNGYVLAKANKRDLYQFDSPLTVWTYGIGRPTLANCGSPMGLVAMFTARSESGGTGPKLSRNKSDVVQIDPSYTQYKLAFSLVDYDGLNTPFLWPYEGEAYVCYSRGKRRLLPKLGTSEIVFTRLPRELFAAGR